MLTDPVFHKVLKNTLSYTVLFVLLSCVFPYITSFLLGIVIEKGRICINHYFYSSCDFFGSGGDGFTWILNPVSGPIAVLLGNFGLRLPMWMNLQGWVIAVIAGITAWKVFGYNFIVILQQLWN